jgi:crossover junction endodeoxyribonuclease RusA
VGGGSSIELPWPPAKLSPNASHAGSWWIKRAAASKYRDDCIVLLRNQRVPRLFVDPPVMLELTFCPPSRRRFDLDNASG